MPNTVHQIYDYPAPSFLLFLSLQCVQHYLRPQRHVLWVNDEGRFRRQHWEGWMEKAAAATPDISSSSSSFSSSSWELQLHNLIIRDQRIIVRFLPFPSHPPGNTSTPVSNKAHRSDFVRLAALLEEGYV